MDRDTTETPLVVTVHPHSEAPTPGLRLTRLTLVGFKSFADRTEFTFEDPITGVVGPNGCGKSNLVDAIKWVLGERSSKSLRGKEMIDVIFAGSAGRKPSGMASVTLTFENPRHAPGTLETPTDQSSGVAGAAACGGPLFGDVEAAEAACSSPSAIDDPALDSRPHHDIHVTDEEAEIAAEEGASEASAIITERRRIGRPLPIDADEVEVERRLYRDGKSQYLINGRLARLRDIRDLFLDTGVGADAYSIIEQGKVDAMLLASPGERRTIFEEAAGIAKYKQRRVEAQRKLERTEANLVRTREQLDSTERRLRFVRGQAAKARRFRELDSEHRSLRMLLAFDQYDAIRRDLHEVESSIDQTESARNHAAAALAQIESTKQRAELDRHDLLQKQRRAEDELRSAEHERASADQRGAMAARSVEEAARQLDLERHRLDETAAQMNTLETALERRREEIGSLGEALFESEQRLDVETRRRAEASGAQVEQRNELSEQRSVQAEMEHNLASLRGSIHADDHKIQSLGEQKVALETRRAARAGDRESLESQLGEGAARLGAIESRIASLEDRLAQLRARAATLSDDRQARSQRVTTLDQSVVRLDSRRATLDEMARSRVGLADAVKAVFDRRQSGQGFDAAIAPLAELIETHVEHALQVELALGPLLQAVLVPDVASTPSHEACERLPGRVTFLPLESLDVQPRVENSIGDLLLVAGARLVELRPLARVREGSPFADRVDALLDRLLGRTMLVESVDAALLLAAGPMPGHRFVTADGALVEADGRVTAGPPGAVDEGMGLLQRHSELSALVSELTDLREQLDVERTGLSQVDSEVAQLDSERSALESELAEARRRVVAEQTLGDRLAADLGRCERELATLEAEMGQIAGRIAGAEQNRTALRERASKLERLLGEQSERVSHLESALDALDRTLHEAGERMSAARVEVGRLGEQLASARREVSRLETESDALERRRDEAERHLEQATQRAEHYRSVIDEAGAQARAAAEAGEKWRTDLAGLSQRVEESTLHVGALSRDLAEARRAAATADAAWHEHDARRRELQVRRETLEERTREELALDLSGEYEDYRTLVAEPDLDAFDAREAAARANVLRDEIRRLGNVNLDSIEEEAQLEEKNEELVAQVADIDEARIRLATLIERLNIASREQFGEVFEKIRENFGGRDGMFRRLFGGGRAEVRLMGLVKEVDGQKVQTDEIDLLESGIEVIAKPPGKEPRSISQLSGGEKTLTAVALLMSIFRSKPSCFCILDEVDAALDEANVGRFCATVREFTDMSRFIVITHNKRTMQVADHLYGVTQQERGVSKRVSVRFDQVEDDGRINAAGEDQRPAAPPVISTAAASPGPVASNRPSSQLRKALIEMRDTPIESAPSNN
ncbi:MAG: chromosome segregation protein SMC [Leptolyngbya sp. PLA3]|nr:MAG: chromosome segregation protein SMC [Cyanobacteria bacterium CYA]MCE7969948.1 chromosome segregation protein SMC [Leptolyngbya sp. PL-A3]